MDDSEDSNVRDDYRQMLRSLGTRNGARISYAGYEEKSRFADLLIEEGGFPRDVIHFALFGSGRFGFRDGGNRNAILLHTVGDTIFCPDDDTFCKITPAPEPREGVRFTTGCDPADFWFFSDREKALGSVSPVEQDLLDRISQPPRRDSRMGLVLFHLPA